MAESDLQQLIQQGLHHHRAGRLAEAERLYREVLGIEPNHADALHLLGLLAMHVGRGDVAVELLSRAVAIRPEMAGFQWDLGKALAATGQWPAAMAAYERAIQLGAEGAELWNDVGNAFQINGQWANAVQSYEKGIAIKPELADLWNNLGSARTELGELEEAERCLRRAIELRAEYPEAYNNLGNALQAMGKLEDSLGAYETALAQRPDYARVYNNLGRALWELDRQEQAVAAFTKSIELSPRLADGHNSLGTAMLDECRIDDAVASFRRAIELNPSFAEAHQNLGRALLLSGDLENGWNEYEWRWGMKDVIKGYPRMHQPVWGGEPLEGRSVLLHAEQGFGDTIQFVRYAPQVKARGGRVVLAGQKELKQLLETAEGIDQVVVEGEPLPPFDVRAPLLSLPRILGTRLDSIPNDVPYLRADENHVARFQERVGTHPPFRVGLVWSGRPTYQDDRRRSMRFEVLSPLLEVPDFAFHSLQTGEAAGQVDLARVKDWSSELQSFADTAALLMNLDLLITVDTAIAHLAGALGRHVWVLLPFSPDWRWMLNREDTPWYPTMRLFRQEKPGDWESPIHHVRRAMGEL